ncbi:MAG: DUF308 domain-containing protein [Anaerolineaceae bacterium]|nr:DUF308 domain-containing protein [Anaerolineaceae bacterium]
MNKFQRCLAVIVFIFFEVYAGVRLLTAPADFSSSAVIATGAALLVLGAICLFWSLTLKGMMLPYRLGLIVGILHLILGVIFVVWSSRVVAAFPIFTQIYGFIMIVMGVSKLGDYFILKAYGLPRHWLWIAAAVLTIIMGVVIIMNPFGAVEFAWTWTGYMLIFSGVFDLFVFIFSFFM